MPPTSFEQVGSIVHVNLDDALLPYKYVIGQVLLDKVPSCRTVVNKVGKIVSPWRTFDMEVLAGEKDTHVTVREGSCGVLVRLQQGVLERASHPRTPPPRGLVFPQQTWSRTCSAAWGRSRCRPQARLSRVCQRPESKLLRGAAGQHPSQPCGLCCFSETRWNVW